MCFGNDLYWKTTLINESNVGVDMDEEIFPLLTEEENDYVCQTPWTEEIGNKMDELVRIKLRNVDFENAKNMQLKIEEEIKKSNIPTIYAEVNNEIINFH